MIKRIGRALVLASIGATVAIATPAAAGTTEEFNHEVRYGDLNLTTDTGIAMLQQRIKSAARQACGYADGRDLNASQAVTACRRAVIANATPKLELAVANARSGEALAANAALKVGKPVAR